MYEKPHRLFECNVLERNVPGLSIGVRRGLTHCLKQELLPPDLNFFIDSPELLMVKHVEALVAVGVFFFNASKGHQVWRHQAPTGRIRLCRGDDSSEVDRHTPPLDDEDTTTFLPHCYHGAGVMPLGSHDHC